MNRRPQRTTLFPYTTLCRSEKSKDGSPPMPPEGKRALLDAVAGGKGFVGCHCASDTFHSDRKSTRLNSSHANISYRVFCLKNDYRRQQLSRVSTRPRTRARC